MSFPTIPNISPSINITTGEAVNLLLASVAFEELGLAHIINAEAEKIQFILGTLPGQTTSVPPTIDDIISIDRSVQMMLRTVIKHQMLLQFKLEDILDTSVSTTTTETTTTTTTMTTTTMTTTTTTTTATMSTTTTATSTTAAPQPLFLFGDIASAAGRADSITVTAADNAYYHSNFNPVFSGYTFAETPIIGVPTVPQPSIHLVKEVSVTQGTSWDDANAPIGPELPLGFKAWFRITVSNNGNVPLNNVTITDPSLGLVRILLTPLANGAGVQIIAVPL